MNEVAVLLLQTGSHSAVQAACPKLRSRPLQKLHQLRLDTRVNRQAARVIRPVTRPLPAANATALVQRTFFGP